MNVILGSDSEGRELKDYIKLYLLQNGYHVTNKAEDKDFVEITYDVA